MGPADSAERRGGITITTFSVPAALARSWTDLWSWAPSAVKRRMGTSSGARRSGSVEASSRLLAVSSAATMNPSASTPMRGFRQFRRFFDVLRLCAFHSPRPRILSPVESTIRSIGPSWARVRGGTTTIWFRRERVVGSGALRSRLIKLSGESRNPSVWRSGRPKTTRGVNAVRIARFEYRRRPPRRPFFGGIHAAIASSLSQIVTSPRLLRPRSYSLQFRILYFVLYWRLIRLDFPRP